MNKKTAKITFKSVETAESYKIYRKKEGTTSYKYIGSTTSLEYIDSTMKAGNTYVYSVVATKDSSKVVSQNSVGRSIVALAAPKVSLVSKKKGRVKLTINPVKSAEKYAIFIKKSGEKGYKLLKNTSKTTILVKKLQKKTTYFFKIKAYKGENTSTTSSLFRTYKIKVK